MVFGLDIFCGGRMGNLVLKEFNSLVLLLILVGWGFIEVMLEWFMGICWFIKWVFIRGIFFLKELGILLDFWGMGGGCFFFVWVVILGLFWDMVGGVLFFR